MTKLATLLSVLLLAAAVSQPAWACGDSLYRVGKGVAYRIYTAPLPGNVLVYGHTPGAEELAKALSASGHNVRLAGKEVSLGLAMGERDYDVVISTYDNREQVEAALKQADRVRFIPVALNDEEARLARESYGKVMLADRDELKNYLKAIHKTLKSRS